MRWLLISIALLLSATSALACSCRSIAGMSEDVAGQARALDLARRYVGAAHEVLRVRVLNRTESGNARTYAVQVLETIKGDSAAPQQRVLYTGPDSCQAEYTPGEEWVVFVRSSRVAQCSGDALLANGRTPPDMKPEHVRDMNEFYYRVGARTVDLVRTVLATQPAELQR